MNGLSLQRVLLILLTVAGWIANAADKRVVVPVATIGDGTQVAAVIPGERELLYMLVMNGGFIIWSLLKDAYQAHKKKSDHSAEDIAEMKLSMQTMTTQLKHVVDKLEKVPTEKEVELKIYQIVRRKDL